MPRLSPKGPSNVVVEVVLASAVDEDLRGEKVIGEHFARDQDQEHEGEYGFNVALTNIKAVLDDATAEVLAENLVEHVFEGVAADHVLKQGHAEGVIAEVLDNETFVKDMVTKVFE